MQFCTRFVSNSSLYRPKFINNDDFDDPFELLFETAIQDLKLKQYYRQRECDVPYDTNNDNNSYDDVYHRKKKLVMRDSIRRYIKQKLST